MIIWRPWELLSCGDRDFLGATTSFCGRCGGLDALLGMDKDLHPGRQTGLQAWPHLLLLFQLHSCCLTRPFLPSPLSFPKHIVQRTSSVRRPPPTNPRALKNCPNFRLAVTFGHFDDVVPRGMATLHPSVFIVYFEARPKMLRLTPQLSSAACFRSPLRIVTHSHSSGAVCCGLRGWLTLFYDVSSAARMLPRARESRAAEDLLRPGPPLDMRTLDGRVYSNPLRNRRINVCLGTTSSLSP